ncbi:glycosyltransferase family 4 protein [Acidisoma sp.]|uniref:glycosyltransferase family 4 protein n=1 Tax=Acidisoma sp. TaxID=1872115 RepID=UPI003B00C8B2
MRIALIDPSLFSLPYDRALASGLGRIGHTVALHGRALRSGDGSPGTIAIHKSFYPISEGPVCQSLPGPLRLGIKGVDHAWSMWRLLKQLRREAPDVIHFQWLPLPLLDRAFLKALRQVAPIVLTVHDTNPFNGEASAAIQRQGVGACLFQFDRLIVHTKQGEERLQKLGMPKERITVLPHGMLVDPVPTAPDAMEGRLTFLLFGKIKPYKGADLLIKALAGLPPSLRAQARVRIVGKPYMDVSALQAQAAAAGVIVEIETGFVEDEEIASLFSHSTVATFPYREIEASGVLFLALAHGRPIIASRLGAFGELLTDGQHGALVPVEDVPALTKALQHMLSDRAFAAACAASVQELAGSIPDWDTIADRTVGVYRDADRARAASVVEKPALTVHPLTSTSR